MFHSKITRILSVFILFLVSAALSYFGLVKQLIPDTTPKEPIKQEQSISTPIATGISFEGFPVNPTTPQETIYDTLSMKYTHRYDRAVYDVFYGIDVSEWNHKGEVDWVQIKNSGIDFAIIRVAARGYGADGILKLDPCFKQNMDAAQSVGLPVGVYIYSQATTVSEAEEEAETVLHELSAYDIELPVVMDCEFADESVGFGRLYQAGLSADEYTNICNSFCRKITAAGYQPMIYANKNMLNEHIHISALDDNIQLWVAQYSNECQFLSADYAFWQFTDRAKIEGMDEPCDLNFWYVKRQKADIPLSIADALKLLQSDMAIPESTTLDTDTYKPYIDYAYKAGLFLDTEDAFVGIDAAKISDLLYALYKTNGTTESMAVWIDKVGLDNGILSDGPLTYGDAALILYRFLMEDNKIAESLLSDSLTDKRDRCLQWLKTREYIGDFSTDDVMSNYELVELFTRL